MYDLVYYSGFEVLWVLSLRGYGDLLDHISGLWDRKVAVVSQTINITCEPLMEVRRYVRVGHPLGQFQCPDFAIVCFLGTDHVRTRDVM